MRTDDGIRTDDDIRAESRAADEAFRAALVAAGHLRAPRRPWQEITAEVAALYDATLEDLVGRKDGPRKRFAVARAHAFCELRERNGLKPGQIGRLFDGRDHSTVWRALRRHAERLAKGEVPGQAPPRELRTAGG